jgi:hypothetical protein
MIPHRPLPPTLRLLALAAFALAGCQGELSQADLDALEALPVAERLPRLEQLLAADPKEPRLPGLLARARYEGYREQPPLERIDAIKAALRAEPESAIVSKMLGDAYYDHAGGEGGVSYLDSALFAYENAALKLPSFLSAVGSVGALYDEKEDYEQAIAWYEKALALSPRHVPTLCNLGASHYNRGEHAQAIDYYRQASPAIRAARMPTTTWASPSPRRRSTARPSSSGARWWRSTAPRPWRSRRPRTPICCRKSSTRPSTRAARRAAASTSWATSRSRAATGHRGPATVLQEEP